MFRVGWRVRYLARELPYYAGEAQFECGAGGYAGISPYRMPMRVSLAYAMKDDRGEKMLPLLSSFPAILDTGFNGGLLLTRQQLQAWTGIGRHRFGVKMQSSNSLVRGCKYDLYAAVFVIRPNKRGTWESLVGGECVKVPSQIIIVDSNKGEFPVPLLGMRAMAILGAKITINCDKENVTITAR
jgi:hypothetical protein